VHQKTVPRIRIAGQVVPEGHDTALNKKSLILSSIFSQLVVIPQKMLQKNSNAQKAVLYATMPNKVGAIVGSAISIQGMWRWALGFKL
jgi:hypothetical protein